MPTEVLRNRDQARHGARALLRLEITDHATVVIVHELGPPRGPDDGEARRNRWQAWAQQLQPPTLTDDRGTVYTLERRAELRAAGGNPRTDHLPMQATVVWRFLPRPDPAVRRWTVDGQWTVQRPETRHPPDG